MKPLSEYRHLVEEAGRFLVMTGEEVTTTWGDANAGSHTHWINVFNTPEPLAPQHDPDSSRCAMQAAFNTARSLGDRSRLMTDSFLS